MARVRRKMSSEGMNVRGKSFLENFHTKNRVIVVENSFSRRKKRPQQPTISVIPNLSGRNEVERHKTIMGNSLSDSDFSDDGAFHYAASRAAYESYETAYARGRDVPKVGRAIRSALGGQFYVQYAGSRARRTWVSSRSDTDLKIFGPRVLNSGDRRALTRALRWEFGYFHVSTWNPNIHIVSCESGQIDVAPSAATYLKKGWDGSVPSRGWLHNNSAAIDAIRMLKRRYPGESGIAVEGIVREYQEGYADASGRELYQLAEDRLSRGCLLRVLGGVLCLPFTLIRGVWRLAWGVLRGVVELVEGLFWAVLWMSWQIIKYGVPMTLVVGTILALILLTQESD